MNYISKIILFTLLFGYITPLVQAAPISSTNKYAWSDQVGWINFNPTNGGVDVSDTTLTGSAWSDNYGWINLQPTMAGVDNLVENTGSGCIGNLSGYAWNTNLGWLDFENVYIDSNGDFQGTASGSLFGSVSFQGTNFGVNTSWRPDCVAPSAPNAPDLLSSSDTGVGSGTTDNITSQTLPSFELVCSEAPSTLTLYSGTGVIATHNCTATGTVNVTSTVVLGEGNHSITYTETDPSNHVSPASSNLDITIDTTLPNIAITAPTKLDNTVIHDTTFTLTDSHGVNIDSILLGTGSLSSSSLSCTPSSGIAPSVTCTVSIDSSGDFSVTADDVAGNTRTVYENNYIVDTIAPSTPSVTVDTSGGVNAPTLTFVSTDNISLDYYEIEYLADDAGIGLGTLTTLTGATSPQTLTLDPDTLTHTLKIRAYDTAGNMSETTITLPLLVTFTVPTPISNTTINDASVTITNPNNNPVTNIILSPGTTGVSLGGCTGSGSDMSDPYDSPVTCTITGITSSGNIIVSAEDSVTGAQGQNTQSFTIETTLPTLSLIAPTKIDNIAITDTTIVVMDDTGILANAVSLSSSTASYSNLVCTQTNPTRVDCTVQVDSSGNIAVSVTDRAGNTNSTIESGYVIDTIAPSVSINTPVVAYSGNQNSYPVSGTCTIGDGNISFTLSGAIPETQSITCSGSGTWSAFTNVSNIPNGMQTLKIIVSQTDISNNTTLLSPVFSDKDNIAPVIYNPHSNPFTLRVGKPFLISPLSCNDNIDINCNVSQSGVVDINTTGTYYITYNAIDSFGNESIYDFSVVVKGNSGGYSFSDNDEEDEEIIIEEENEENLNIEEEEEEDIITEEENEENISETAEEEGYMTREVNGKIVGYTLKETFKSCPIIDALNDTIPTYSGDLFDDIENTPQRDIINLFAALNIVNGNIDGYFEPQRNITRAEFTKMVLISHCYSYQQEDTEVPIYKDLKKNTWEARVVSKAQSLGIISGYEDGTFKPEQIITKAEATKILMRMSFIQTNQIENLQYNDIEIDWQKKYIQIGESLGIFDAKQDNNKFYPDQGIVRENMVDMIHTIVDLYR